MEEKKKTLSKTFDSIKECGLKVGTALSIAGIITTMAFASTFPGESIKVPKNSTLSQIAQQSGTTWQRLEKRNNLENPDYIQEGQKLVLYHDGGRGLFQKMYDTIDKYWF